MTEFSIRYPEKKTSRIFESTTVQILDEVAQGHSELGIIYLNRQNTKGIMQRVDKLGAWSGGFDSFSDSYLPSQRTPSG